jgi:hypothetical protein
MCSPMLVMHYEAQNFEVGVYSYLSTYFYKPLKKIGINCIKTCDIK